MSLLNTQADLKIQIFFPQYYRLSVLYCLNIQNFISFELKKIFCNTDLQAQTFCLSTNKE